MCNNKQHAVRDISALLSGSISTALCNESNPSELLPSNDLLIPAYLPANTMPGAINKAKQAAMLLRNHYLWV